MLDHVVQRLDDDVIKVRLEAGGKTGSSSSRTSSAGRRGVPQYSAVVRARAGQPLPLQVGRTELIEQQAHLAQGVQGGVLELGQAFLEALGVAVSAGLPPGAAEEDQAVERLGDRVVQVAGQPLPFGQDRHLFGLAAQAVVSKHQADLLRQGRDQGNLVRAVPVLGESKA